MSLTYHVTRETRKSKDYFTTTPSLGEIEGESSFDLLQKLSLKGRLLVKGSRIAFDPFVTLDLHFEVGEQLRAYYCLREERVLLTECEWVCPASPSWVLHRGIARAFRSEISSRWVRLALQGQELTGQALFDFIEAAEGEVSWEWTGKTPLLPEPEPVLLLADRHGAFADLGFDYGGFGRLLSHETPSHGWRNRSQEAQIEADLLETAFKKKQVDRTHYYCPLNEVAKSLTFLLEVGWRIEDAAGRRLVRQGRTEVDLQFTGSHVQVLAHIHYAEHRVDVQDLVGAFNRREQFVVLGESEVALFDREGVSELFEEELVSEGFRLKKPQASLLETLPLTEPLRERLASFFGSTKPSLPSDSFQGTLFPYQQQGVNWLQFLSEGKFGGLLADEMGLGKTVQVLAFFSQLEQKGPWLVVCPTSLLFNWQREIERFLPTLAVYRHEGKERLSTLEGQSLILTSYALLRLDAPLFQSIPFQLVALDEAQAIKNADSQTSEICRSLQAKMRLAITGTPVENRLEELLSLFRFLEPDLFTSKQPLLLPQIKRKIRPFLLRRRKEEVGLQLPLKLEQTVFVEMEEEQRSLYEEWLKRTRKKVTLEGGSPSRMQVLEAILRLRQICAHPQLVGEGAPSSKLERLLSDIEEAVAEGRKILVYSQFTSMLRLIAAALTERALRFVYLDGGTHNREEVVRQFQEDASIPLFLISLKAGGVGLNLTAADYVFLYDPWWNDAVENQAIDRAHRLGRQSTVIARRYIAALTIEEKILRLKSHKTTLSTAALSSDEETAISFEDLLALLDL